MTWNFRVLAHKSPFDENDIGFQIHDVHYDKKMKPKAFSETPAMIGGDSIEDIKWILKEIELCLEKSILDANNFPNDYKPKQSNEQI